MELDERLTGVHPDAQPQRRAAERRQRRRLVADPQRCADGPLGIVLVGPGDAEDTDHGVADELLDDPAVGLDLRPGDGEVARQHLFDVLGIGALGGRGEADEVAEQHADRLALRAGRVGIAADGVEDDGGAPPRRDPQLLQKRAAASFARPHAAQTRLGPSTRGVYARRISNEQGRGAHFGPIP